MALVFLWFGANQLMDSSLWEGFVPLWIVDFGVSAKLLVTVNGVMEVVLGVMLILGLWVRWVALVLALHLMGIAATIGLMRRVCAILGWRWRLWRLLFAGSS